VDFPIRAHRAGEDDLVLAVVIEVNEMRLPSFDASRCFAAALRARHTAAGDGLLGVM
jgi:hypothetical protein